MAKQFVLGVLAWVALAGCAGTLVTPQSTASPRSFSVIDTVTKSSVERDKVVFAVLVEGAGAPLMRPLRAEATWGGSEPSAWCWLDAQSGPGPSPFPYSSERPCVLVERTRRAQFCAGFYDPPAAKELDSTHPDAVQPALEGLWYLSNNPFRGWVSWQVEIRSDCETRLIAQATQYSTDLSGNWPEIPIGEWTEDGRDAGKPGAEHLVDVLLTDAEVVASDRFSVPDAGKLVMRAVNGGSACRIGAALLRWNASKPPAIQPDFVLSLAEGQRAVELDLEHPVGFSGSYTAYVTGCSGTRFSLVRRGPPY